MRIKDEVKQEAIISATIKLVNEIGFVASSVARIAKEANVSPATLYIYYSNKEDLLVSTYVEIKKKLSKCLLENFDESKPLRDIFKKFLLNGFEFSKKIQHLYQYVEQFTNTPYTALVNHQDIEKHFEPLYAVLKKGVDQKIIKDVPTELLVAFIFHPMMILANKKECKSFQLTEVNMELAFSLAWDAIKL